MDICSNIVNPSLGITSCCENIVQRKVYASHTKLVGGPHDGYYVACISPEVTIVKEPVSNYKLVNGQYEFTGLQL